MSYTYQIGFFPEVTVAGARAAIRASVADLCKIEDDAGYPFTPGTTRSVVLVAPNGTEHLPLDEEGAVRELEAGRRVRIERYYDKPGVGMLIQGEVIDIQRTRERDLDAEDAARSLSAHLGMLSKALGTEVQARTLDGRVHRPARGKGN